MAAPAGALPQCLGDLLPAQVVLHTGCLGHAVIEHRAVEIDEGDAVRRAYLIRGNVLQALLQLLRLLRQRGKGLLFIIPIQDTGEKTGPRRQHQQCQAKQAADDLSGHTCPPSL